MYRRLKSNAKYLIVVCIIIIIIMVNNQFGHNIVSHARRFPMPLRTVTDASPVQPHHVAPEHSIGLSVKDVKTERIAKAEPPHKAEYERRRNVAFKACLDNNRSDWLDSWPRVKAEPKFKHSPMVSTKRKLFYCPVGKVASSFFTRWVLAMNKPGPMTSPYSIAMKDAGRGRAESVNRLPSKQIKMSILNSSTRLVFGRNPYSRIFSAYIDKIFSPNPFYWRYWGDIAVRLDNSAVKKCNTHVTFSQFVRAVTMNLSKSDVHLIPVSDECNVCQMPYDVVGKLENTVEDLDYASTLLNISSSFQHEPSYKKIGEHDMILDSVFSAFSWRSSIKGCGVSLHEMGLRIWRKFQIRGIIDRSIAYPFKPGALERMTIQQFIKASENAISKSTDTDRLKKQKAQAMEEAYSSLSNGLIEQIQKAYDLEFAYFEYKKQPDFLSKNTREKYVNKNNGIFQVETPWV